MRLVELTVRDFRSYQTARLSLGSGLTVISGPNGAGKTNLLEAIYFGCTGRSCRTNNEREVLRFSAPAARVVVCSEAIDGRHEFVVGFQPGRPKLMKADGAAVERLVDVTDRPLVSVFMPDRLELIKGPPALRRAHVDQVIAALWPSRVATRRAYSQTLAQRNALIARIRSGHASRGTLASWNAQLAGHGVALMSDRASAVTALSEHFARLASRLGLDGEPSIAYRPRSHATSSDELADELASRTDGDLQRGFTTHGPHRDDLVLTRAGHDLRAYGSQGQQRLALLSLLLAEREAIAATRAAPPLMLLDDVMSELDRDHRAALVELLLSGGGQSVITTTELAHVPGASGGSVTRVAVADGRLLQEVNDEVQSAAPGAIQ